MSKSVVLFMACCAACTGSFAQSAGNAASGQALAEKSCFYCHGPDGNGNKGVLVSQREAIPRISGQPQLYFIKSMNEYKNGLRPNVDMSIVAEQCSDEDIRNLAAWYATQLPSATATYDHGVF